MSASSRDEIVIVGAGIVGLMSGLSLLEKGYGVTFIDRYEPGDSHQASYGNAGSISIGNVMPMGKPGFIRDGLGMLLDPLAPLMMPRTHWHRSLPWVAKVTGSSSQKKSSDNARAIGALNLLSATAWHHWVEDLGLADLIQQNGWLKLYETEKSFAKTVKERSLMEEMGLPYEVLDKKQILDREPDLAPTFSGAIYQSTSLAINNPSNLVKRLAAAALERGANFIKSDVQEIQRREQGYRITLPDSHYDSKLLLVTGGAWSQRLLKPLGYSIPLETERGYHLMFESRARLSGPVINMDRYIALCPMAPHIRMTSCVELAGLDKPADYTRIDKLAKVAESFLPKLGRNVIDRWMGFRPSLPDSKPVIGAASNDPGLYLAFGHGHLGITQSAGTGQLIAGMINQEPDLIDPLPYSSSRFIAG